MFQSVQFEKVIKVHTLEQKPMTPLKGNPNKATGGKRGDWEVTVMIMTQGQEIVIAEKKVLEGIMATIISQNQVTTTISGMIRDQVSVVMTMMK